jgi:hypothetical protein
MCEAQNIDLNIFRLIFQDHADVVASKTVPGGIDTLIRALHQLQVLSRLSPTSTQY